MKKFILLSMLGLLMSVSTFSQNVVGINAVNNATGGSDNAGLGVGIKLGYQVGDFRIVPSYNYFFRDKATEKTDRFSANLDVQYLLTYNKFTVYPLVGFNYTSYDSAIVALVETKGAVDAVYGDDGVEISPAEDAVYDEVGLSPIDKRGINLGGGIEYQLTKNTSVGIEAKQIFLFDKRNVAVISAGLAYKF